MGVVQRPQIRAPVLAESPSASGAGGAGVELSLFHPRRDVMGRRPPTPSRARHAAMLLE